MNRPLAFHLRPSIGQWPLVGVLLLVLAAAAFTFSGVPPTAAAVRDQAIEVLLTRSGSNCVESVDILSSLDSQIDTYAAKAGVNGGWVVPGRLFLGGLADDAAAALSGEVVGRTPGAAWLLYRSDGALELARVVELSSPAGTHAWLVHELLSAIAC